jgi:hypothetical protein
MEFNGGKKKDNLRNSGLQEAFTDQSHLQRKIELNTTAKKTLQLNRILLNNYSPA